MIKTPFVRVHYLRPIVNSDGSLADYEVVALYADGRNIASSKYLSSFKYTYEIEGSDSCSMVFNFNTTDLDLTVFQEGVRLAVSWGYTGESVAIRDLVIDKVKGKYTQNGYTISLDLIPPIAYADKYDYEGDLADRLTQMGGFIEYEFYNADTGENLVYKYYPQNNSFNIDGTVRKYRPTPIPLKTSYTPVYIPSTPLGGYSPSSDAYRLTAEQAKARGLGSPSKVSPTQSAYIKERLKTIISRLTAEWGVREAQVLRDDKVLLTHNTHLKGPIRAYTVGPSKAFEKVITFSFDTGKDSTTSEEDADIELAIIDPNYKTEEKIRITKTWRVVDPETGAYETFNVVKKDGVFYYESEGVLLSKLSSQEILRLKKVEMKYRYNEYSYGEQEVRNELGRDKSGSFNTGNVMGRDLVTVKESAYELDKARGAENVPKGASPLMDQILFSQGYTNSERSLERDKPIIGEGFVKQFFRRGQINGLTFDEVLQKGVAKKLDSIFYNIVCELTIKGDQHLESDFNFVVMNAGHGVSGKYRCIKATHSIQAGKYVLTLSGAKIPPDVSIAIDSMRKSIESSVRELEIRNGVFNKMGLITSEIFSSSGEATIQRTQVPSVAKLFDGFNLLPSGLKFEDKVKPIEGKKSTNTAVASSPEELHNMKEDPATVKEMKRFEIYTKVKLNDVNQKFSTISKRGKSSATGSGTPGVVYTVTGDPIPDRSGLKQFSTIPIDKFNPERYEP